MQVLIWKLWCLAFVKGYSAPWISFLICLSLLFSLFLALVKCLAMAVDMLRALVCWNHTDGIAVWCVSLYVLVEDSSLHMVLTLL